MSITQEQWWRYREITEEQKLRELLRYIPTVKHYHTVERNFQAVLACDDILGKAQQLWGEAYLSRILAEAKPEAAAAESDELLKCDVCGTTPVFSIDVHADETGTGLVYSHYCREHTPH